MLTPSEAMILARLEGVKGKKNPDDEDEPDNRKQFVTIMLESQVEIYLLSKYGAV